MPKRNKKKYQQEPEALQQSKRLRDCAQSRARLTKDDSDRGVCGPRGGMLSKSMSYRGMGLPHQPMLGKWA